MDKKALLEEILGSGALGPIAGLASGLPVGRSLAGATAAEVAPHGKVTRSEDVARKAALIGAPAAGIGALMLARKYGLGGRAAEFIAKKFPAGAIMDPNAERQIIQEIVPFLSAFGGSAAGGLATGTMVGGAAHMLPNRYGKKDDEQEKDGSLTESSSFEKLRDVVLGKEAADRARAMDRKVELDKLALSGGVVQKARSAAGAVKNFFTGGGPKAVKRPPPFAPKVFQGPPPAAPKGMFRPFTTGEKMVGTAATAGLGGAGLYALDGSGNQ
jgi:hypothetical protein